MQNTIMPWDLTKAQEQSMIAKLEEEFGVDFETCDVNFITVLLFEARVNLEEMSESHGATPEEIREILILEKTADLLTRILRRRISR